MKAFKSCNSYNQNVLNFNYTYMTHMTIYIDEKNTYKT